MNKLIATIVATIALLLGGAAAVAPASANTGEPSCIDSDGDGYPDGAVDSDGDGELNDPTYPDADGDGHPDNPCISSTPLPAGAGDGTDPAADAPAVGADLTDAASQQAADRKAERKAKKRAERKARKAKRQRALR